MNSEYQFKVGDKVIFNKKASTYYLIASEGRQGLIVRIAANYFYISFYPFDKKDRGYPCCYGHFDLDKKYYFNTMIESML